jgi:hypothetical protein
MDLLQLEYHLHFCPRGCLVLPFRQLSQSSSRAFLQQRGAVDSEIVNINNSIAITTTVRHPQCASHSASSHRTLVH